MSEFNGDVALGFLYAAAVGFLAGRTREQDDDPTPKPGLRDFVILALLGALCAQIEAVGLTIVLMVAASAVMLVMRIQYPQRTGITTELAALMTFLLGYLCLTKARVIGISMGIILAVLLTTKEQVHRFALQTISGREYGDTLKFLALIFVIYPLLPKGGFGPFHFFEPQKIWLFVILVAAVSYVGYFLTKFLDPGKGITVTAIVGGLASTTAYTGGVSKVVAESPQTALPMAGAALLANSIQYPRLLLIIALINPTLFQAALVPLWCMMIAGLIAAAVLVRSSGQRAAQQTAGGFKNPLTLGPALKFGVVFTAILLLTRAGKVFFGQSGQLITSSVGGLIDTDAVLLSLTDFFAKNETTAHDAVLGIILAAAANAVLKSVLAYFSRQPAFYFRLMAGFAFIAATGLLVFFTVGV
ncbi:MAG: MgtC/SapB family protein [Verrucomicrobia bacterium]|nr:MgtC/SapB family protein [Verrucomicrobiota bacterium]